MDVGGKWFVLCQDECVYINLFIFVVVVFAVVISLFCLLFFLLIFASDGRGCDFQTIGSSENSSAVPRKR